MKKKDKVLKDLDGWIEVFVIDPITRPIVGVCSQVSSNPLFFTAISVILTLIAAILLFYGHHVYAVVLYFLSIVSDGVDGKIARYKQNKIIIHGVLDVMTDQLRNAVYLIALYLRYPHLQIFILLFVILLLTYEFNYAIRLETKTRFFPDQPRDYSLIKLKKYYESEMKDMNPSFLKIIQWYNSLFTFTSRYRTYPFPTIVDAEFVFFVIVVATLNPIIAVIGVLMLIPDTAMSIALTFILGKRAEANSHKK